MRWEKNQFALISLTLLVSLALFGAPGANAQEAKKPNIVIIWGDDIGQSNISAYTNGLMGYRTPNIDLIAQQGVIFTDYYGEQSCTAGRSAFITGQSVFRTGLSKVGLPGADLGLSKDDPTIAELLKAQGYATGQFGKNHLGDKDEFLPTAHGFDEFYGNLYHLNAEEEPELPDYPKADDPEFPNFRKNFGPTRCHPQLCKSGWHATDRRYRAADQEADGNHRRRYCRALSRVPREAGEGEQARVPLGQLHPHAFPHPHQAREPRPGGALARSLCRHDDRPRQKRRDRACQDQRLGIEDNTIVMYSTDNGPHMNSWPDAAMTPFRNEKNSNWEGAYRVPAMVRWPGKIKPGSVSNGHCFTPRLGADLARRGRGAGHQGKAARRLQVAT